MRLPSLRPGFERRADHPWLVGDPSVPGVKLARRSRWTTLIAIVLANAVGAVVVIAFAVVGLPKPEIGPDDHPVVVNIAAAGTYLLFALVVGVAWGRRRLEGGRHGIRGWLEADRDPTAKERRRVLRAPLRLMLVEAVLWGTAVVLFTLLNLQFTALLALGVGLTVALGGLTTSAAVFLLSELALRPVAARALAHGGDDRMRVPGVATRWLLAWALGTGVPVLGVVLVGIVALTEVKIGQDKLAVTMVALGIIALVFGAVVAVLAAEQALTEQAKLGGEAREVAVLFVDIVGSPALAADRDPEEVVQLLNRFFAVVDAALAIFGAPLPVPPRPGHAACGRAPVRRGGSFR